MAKEFSKRFYHSAAWIKTSKAYASSRFYVCEICGKPAVKYVVHHKIHLTPENIGDPQVSLNWDNLQLLCTECHNQLHKTKSNRKIIFDSSGQPIAVVDTPRPDV